jgi:hypothetical protein
MRKRVLGKKAPARRTVRGGAGVTAEHRLLTSDWTADVKSVETAIGRFTADRDLDNECQVVMFELPGDFELHVNVTHQYLTNAVAGWAGPGKLINGYVHNRRFGDTPCSQIVRQIREMVFAGRPGSKALAGTTD